MLIVPQSPKHCEHPEDKMSRVRISPRSATVALLLASSVMTSQAALTTQFGLSTGGDPAAPGAAAAAQATLLGKVGPASVRIEDFEEFATGETFQGAQPPGLTFSPTAGSTGTGTPGTGILTPSLNGVGRVAQSGVSNYEGRFNTTGGYTSGAWAAGRWWEAANDFDVVFGFGVNAFGFYLTDPNDFAGQLDLVITDSTGRETRITDITGLTGTSNGALQFFGFYDDERTYTKARFDITQTTTSPILLGFDDLLIGAAKADGTRPTPEPATLALVALSLGALLTTRRRKNTRV